MKVRLAKMSLKNKAYACVLVVGFGALIADRWSRGGPATAVAGATSPQTLLVSAVDREASSVPQGAPDRSIARMLRAAAQKSNWPALLSATSRDPFTPWGQAGQGKGTSQDQSSSQNPDARFAQVHRLTEVLTSGDRRRIVVNGHILSIGQTLDGFTLIAINGRSATFQSRESRPVLNLDQIPAGAIRSSQ